MSFVNGETSHHTASRSWTDMAVTLAIESFNYDSVPSVVERSTPEVIVVDLPDDFWGQ